MAEGEEQKYGAPQKRLSTKVKRFIVEQVACYESPTEVVKSVKAEYAIDITKQHVEKYDPTKAAGRELSEALEKHFWSTREKYSSQADKNLGSLNYRVSMLHAIAQKALARGDSRFAADILKQIAEDKGGKYTNRREHSGPDGGPIPVSLGDQKRAVAAKMLAKLKANMPEAEARARLLEMGVDEHDLPAIQGS